MPIPRIISVCSKCSIKSNTCKLVQCDKSKNYSIICDDCYTSNTNDIVLNIINYNGKDTLTEESCIKRCKKNCKKCYNYIKCKTTLLFYKIIDHFKCSSEDNTDKLHNIV